MANDAYLVTETPSGNKKIEILTHPDFPIGALLLEILVLNLALTLLTIVFRGFFAFNLLGILAFPVYLVWNQRAKDSLELTEKYLRLKRYRPPFLSAQPSYQKNEIKNLRVIQPTENLAAFENIYILRLLFIQYRGIIGFETPQGMMVRFGWGINEAEAEQVIAIIQQWVDKADS
ncbi:MAG: hypothetical protein CL608_27720 [Anaerolineaceae bacterium]|nr:hypothetical protein [Anaerolineaceae bacterium]